MKQNALTLTGLKGVSDPDNLGRIVTLAMLLADCKDYSYRCEPAELFILETNSYHVPTLFYREDGSSLVKEYRMKCNRFDLMHDEKYAEYVTRLDNYFKGDKHNYMADDIFLCGECDDLFDEVHVYSL